MNSKRFVFLLLAVIVAGTTAFLARTWLQSERQALMEQAGMNRTVQAPSLRVLVAKQNVATGHILKPDNLQWQAWPAGNVPATAPVTTAAGLNTADIFNALGSNTTSTGSAVGPAIQFRFVASQIGIPSVQEIR